jgi:predicted transposase YbfD/YdcC
MKAKPPIVIHFALEAFSAVGDPRVDRCKLHPLMNVLVMSLAGALAGVNGWDELVLFSEAHLPWFETFLDVPHGVPSADTFRRVFEVLDPREVEAAIRQWIRSVSETFEGEVVAIDGKSLKGSIKKAGTTTPLHLLHVWAAGQRLLLGQQRVEGAPGEVAAIPELLKRVHVEGTIVTADANACTTAVTEAVRNAGAHYVLALKGNRGPLHARAKKMFANAEAQGFSGLPTYTEASRGHGRREERIVRVLGIDDPPKGWRELTSVVMVERTRTKADKTTTERSYYITSLGPEPERIAHAIRAHWSIENQLHYILDVAFDEDSRRIRDERAAENYALVCRLALMMLKRSPAKLSVNLKRKKAAWDPKFLSELLFSGIEN